VNVMSYNFENQQNASTRASVRGGDFDLAFDVHNMSQINGKESDANVVMAGLSTMYNIVGWTVDDVVRTVKQNVTTS